MTTRSSSHAPIENTNPASTAPHRDATESWRRAMLFGAIAGAVIGALDETYQSGTPGREVSVYDAMADTAGAACGALAWQLWVAWRRRGRTREATP